VAKSPDRKTVPLKRAFELLAGQNPEAPLGTWELMAVLGGFMVVNPIVIPRKIKVYTFARWETFLSTRITSKKTCISLTVCPEHRQIFERHPSFIG
jgi:hypothetical protein